MYAQNQHPSHDGGAMHRPGSNFGGGPSAHLAFAGQGNYGPQGSAFGGGYGGAYGSAYGGASGRPEFAAGQGMGAAGGQAPGGLYGDPYRGPSAGQGGGEWAGAAAAGGPGWQHAQFQGERGAGQRMDVAFNERTMDKDYNLISVLYHALQGVDTCQRYRQDAQREGSPEVAQFLEQVLQQQQQIALRAKELLFRQRQV